MLFKLDNAKFYAQISNTTFILKKLNINVQFLKRIHESLTKNLTGSAATSACVKSSHGAKW